MILEGEWRSEVEVPGRLSRNPKSKELDILPKSRKGAGSLTLGRGRESTSNLQMHRWASVGAGNTLGLWVCPLPYQAGEWEAVKMGNKQEGKFRGECPKMKTIRVSCEGLSWHEDMFSVGIRICSGSKVP